MIHERCCPYCKQTMPLSFKIEANLPPAWRAMLDIIYRAGEHGISTDRLVNLVYSDDPNGGPDNAVKSIHVRICRMNKRLRPLGWLINGRGDHTGVYVLERLRVTPDDAVALIRRAVP